jgi:DNA-binding SARP family transcriptional activator/tetratricopeptide (TPR) repeat protein
MLAALAVDAGRVVPVGTLVDRVWGEADRSRNALHVCVTRVRQVLARAGGPVPVRLVSRDGGYVLEVEPDRVDAHRFQALLERARDRPDRERVALLREALGLWRGTPLADLPGEWAARVREGWQQQRRDAVIEWAQAELRLDNAGAVIGPLTELTTEFPLVEPLVATLMRALHAAGRGAEALSRYAETRQRLAEELGTDPGEELRGLHRALLRGDLTRAAQPPTSPGPTVPAQLPPDVPGFAGRTAELARLDAILAAACEQPTAPTAVVVSALWGTAGVGKTALAVHWAHRVASRFPDGQLYANLHGFDPICAAVPPGEAVRAFLDALGVAPQRIPVSLDAQVGLYRSTLAGRRMLIVLDNAATAEQVRPLLPGSPGCLVLVTSRNHLTSLVAAEGAHPLSLDLLGEQAARQLLARRVGAERVTTEPTEVNELIAGCAGRPLALAVAAARIAAQPRSPLRSLRAELEEVRQRLGAVPEGDPPIAVRAVFTWAYDALSRPAARLFRLLGVHPGTQLGIPALASLAGIAVMEVRAALAQLTRAHLITELSPSRYGCHDLLRAYAAELAVQVDSDDERQRALHRLVEHYVHTASRASRLLRTTQRPIGLDPPPPGVVPEELADRAAALAWFTTEHPVLLAVLDRAAETGFDRQAGQLAAAGAAFFDLYGRWADWASTQFVALASARRLGDPALAAQAHRGLAGAYSQLGRYDEAHDHYRQALALFGELGEQIGQARTHLSLSLVLSRQNRYPDALAQAERALELFRATGHQIGQARALNAIGWYCVKVHDYQRALGCCEQALTMLRELGDRRGEAQTWDSLGYAHHHLGQYLDAVECFEQAVRLCQELGDRYEEATALAHLGDTRAAAEDPAAARRAWQQSLEIFDQLGRSDSDSDPVRAKLHALDHPEPATSTPA